MKITKYWLLIAFGLITIISACVKRAEVEPDHSVKLTFDTIRITQGITQFLAAKNYQATEINWSSSDTSVVKIGTDGLINAIKPGQVIISAVAKQYAVSAKCVIIVSDNAVADLKLSDVSVGADGSVFAIGTDVVSATGGYGIYKLVNGKLNKLPLCAGVRIAVGPDGKPWVVNKSNLIFKYRDSTSAWQQMPGTASDIGIGADGSVFVTGTQDVSPTGGYNIMKWNGTGWDTMPDCAGIHIAVDPKGIPYVVNRSNLVYKYSGSYLWNTIDGVLANDIGIGKDGSLYVTGSITAAPLYKLTISGGTVSWPIVSELSATSVSVTPTGQPVYIDKQGLLHKP